jgi:penicillin-binding protein 2
MRWRCWLALLLVAVLLGSGCEAQTPTPDGVARNYAQQWERRAYDALYDLLTPAASERISREAFTGRYARIAEEMSLEDVRVEVRQVRPESDERGRRLEDRAAATLAATFTTRLAGDFSRELELRLALQEDRTWRVDWSPAAIVPELTGERLVRMTRLTSSRGRILARDGTELATFGDGLTVGVVPGQIRDETGLLRSLAPLVRLSEAEVKRRYQSGRPDWFMPIRTLPADTPADVREKLSVIAGVQLRPARVRAYPQRSLAAHVIGYVGPITAEHLARLQAKGYREGDIVGTTGLERELEEVLAGPFGWRLGVVEPDESPVATLAERPATAGLDVVLSIDPTVQRAAEAALAVEAKGAAVVEEATTGEILAVASHPSFDLNAFVAEDSASIAAWSADPRKPLFGRATFGQYPIGSTFKLITAAGALREGALQPGERVPCPVEWTGYGPQWRQLNHETGNLGSIDLHTALARSCNTFFYELGKRLNDRSPLLLPETAMSFGLGRATDIEFVLEAEGVVPTPDWKSRTFPNDPVNRLWLPGDATNLAIGQGYLLATPLQMANYVAAVLNDGTLHRPRLVLRYEHRGGVVARTFDAATLGRANARPEHLALVRDGMRGVVADAGGTAFFPFRGFGPQVLGKSGTAETTGGSPDAWFIGGAPYGGPRVAVATLVEEKAGILGSQDAAVMARKVLAAALGVPP